MLVGLLLVLIAVTAVGATGFVAMSSIATLSQDLPDPEALSTLSFDEPTLVYDRTGKVELGRFQRERTPGRRLSPRSRRSSSMRRPRPRTGRSGTTRASTSPAILSAVAENAPAATRARRVDDHPAARPGAAAAGDVVAPGADRYVRKAKEIIQSARLTEAFPGEAGKQRIITAYLNQIFYGHDAYGIAAAAQIYFGVSDLSKLTPAQAALLAGLPKSPSTLDPYRYAETDKKGQLVVPARSPRRCVRRDWILQNLADVAAGRTSRRPSSRRPRRSRSSSPATSR